MFRALVIGAFVVGATALGATTANASVYYENCSEAHADGRYDIPEGDADYWDGGDRDQDGIACES